MTVHDRATLRTVTAPAKVVGGNPIDVVVYADEFATPAGIRLDVALTDPFNIVIRPTTPISITAGRNTTAFALETKKTPQNRTIQLTVSTAGPSIVKTIVLTP